VTALRYGLRARARALRRGRLLRPVPDLDFRASQFALIGVYFIAILGLNILTGYTGQISLGHGAFMAIGAYTTAILVADHGMKDLWTIPIAGSSRLRRLRVRLPALRLSGRTSRSRRSGSRVATPIVIKKFDGFHRVAAADSTSSRPRVSPGCRNSS
jgi:hypothetical protein